MIPVEGLFEAHLTVRDLGRSTAFYRDVVGLELGIAQPERPAAFSLVRRARQIQDGHFHFGKLASPDDATSCRLSSQTGGRLSSSPKTSICGHHSPRTFPSGGPWRAD